jgi:hypothetical protein
MPTLDELAASEPQDDLAALAASEPQDDLASLAASEPPDTSPEPAVPTPQPISLTSLQGTRSGVSGDQAAQALKLSKRTGFAPEMVAQNLDTLQQQVDQTGFEDGIGAAPVLADYAAQGHVQASLIKDDVPALSALNAGFLDVGRQYLARKYMAMEPGPERDVIRGQARNVERVLGKYEATDPGIVAQTARMLPTVAAYIWSGVAGAVATGPAAPGGAIAGPFMLNYQAHVGELYMRLQDAEEARQAADPSYVPRSDKEIREYAKKGAIVSSTFLTTLGQPFLRGLPFATAALERVGLGIVAKAGEDSIVKAAASRLLELGAHTLSGAVTMAGMAVSDDATVQKATTGKIDVGQVTKVGTKAFVDSLGPTAALSVLSPFSKFLGDVGRIRDARIEAVDLAAKVDQAKASKLVKRAPQEAEKIFRIMADDSGSETAYVAEFNRLPPELAQAIARAAGPHAVGDDAVTGGGVAVPIEKYLTQLTGHHEAIKDNVRLSEDGFTPKEAAETKPDTLGALMAVRDYALQSEPDTPERAAKLAGLEKRMRAVASRGQGMPGLGRIATPEEVAAEMAKLETAVPPGEEPPPAAYEIPKTPKTTVDDEAVAREHIEGKTIGEIRPSYYENAGRRAGERLTKLASGPDTESERIFGKYAEALGVSLDSLRNAVQGTFSADTLPQARKKLRTAETEANRLEKGRMQTLTKLEGEHAMNVANRQLAIQEAVRNQKNAKVFGDVAHEIRNEMDRMQEKVLKKAGDTAFLGKLSMAGPEYRDGHDALIAAAFSGPDPQPQPGAIDGLLARMELDGAAMRDKDGRWLASFDAEAIRDFLRDPRQWKDMTPAEARNFADAVSNIRETAQRMNQIARADRLQSKADFIGAVREETAGRKDIGAPRLTRSVASLGERLMRAAGLYNAANLKPETIFSRLGETGQKFFEETIIRARNVKAELQGDILRYFQDNFDKQMREKAKELAKPVETDLTIPETVDLDGSRMNQETLAMAFLNLGTLSNEQRLLGGYGWDKQQVLDDIGKNLKPELVRMLQGILAYHDEKLWPLIREKAAKAGVTPPKIPAQPITITFADGTTETFAGGYFPAAPHPDALNIPSRDGDGIMNLDRFAQATVRAAFTKERVEGASYPVDLNWSRYPAHLGAVLHYLAYDEPVRDIGRLLRDDEFRQIVRHRVGPEYLSQLDDDLRIWARGNADNTRTVSLPSRMFSRVLRTRAVSNALAFSTPIALGQESHIQYAITSGQISLKNGTAAMVRALVPETWQTANETFSELRFRSDHYAQQFREALLTGSAAKSEIMRGVDIAAFAQMDMADRILSHVITDAAYNDALDAGMSHEDAVTQANRKLRLLMPTHNVLEMAPIVRDRGTIGALMLFRGLPNVVWNVEATLYDEAHQQMAAAIGPKMIAAAGGRAALNGARAVASVAVLHMLGRLLMGHGKKEEDGPGLQGWATWAEREAISSQFSRLPLGRDIAEPIVDGLFHDKTLPQIVRDMQSGQHLAPDVSVMVGMLRDLGTMADEGKDPADRIQAGLNTFATTIGVGARPISRAARYGFDVVQGNRSPRGPFDVAGGFVYGERDRQDKNPGTAIQDIISGEQ